MIFHENLLLADASHEISFHIFYTIIRKDVAKSSAAVVIGALRVNNIISMLEPVIGTDHYTRVQEIPSFVCVCVCGGGS